MRIYLYIIVSYVIAACLVLSPPLAMASSSTTLVRTQILMGNVPVTISLDPGQMSRDTAVHAMSTAFQLARSLEVTVETDPHLLKRAQQMGARTWGYFDVRFGLGGIAKGYIVDLMAQQLREKGYRRFLINAGGDLWAESPLHRPPWEVALSTQVSKFCTHQRAVASSGTAERGNHIINPKTGRPLQDRDLLITVLAQDTTTADALATAVFAAGSKRAALMDHLLEQDPTLGFIVSYEKGQVDFRGSTEIGCQTGQAAGLPQREASASVSLADAE